MAGSGKSAIAQSISELLWNNPSPKSLPQVGPSTELSTCRLAASFFFNRQEKNRCSTERVVATIAYQLAVSIPGLKGSICDVLRQDETILDMVVENQLQRLILEPLRSLPQLESSLVIVVDALDECEDCIQMAQIITLLADPTSNP